MSKPESFSSTLNRADDKRQHLHNTTSIRPLSRADGSAQGRGGMQHVPACTGRQTNTFPVHLPCTSNCKLIGPSCRPAPLHSSCAAFTDSCFLGDYATSSMEQFGFVICLDKRGSSKFTTLRRHRHTLLKDSSIICDECFLKGVHTK